MKFLLQLFRDGSSSREIKNARHYALLNNIVVKNMYIEDLSNNVSDDFIPIGDVEFVKKYASISNRLLDTPETYPKELFSFLNRKITKTILSNVSLKDDIFIKPIETKLFTGFCLLDKDQEAIENKKTLRTLPKNTEVYVSEKIKFLQEYRFYFKNSNELAAIARYDNDENNDIDFDNSIIYKMGSLLNKNHPFVIDIGITTNNQIALVEYNDFWAIGMYQGISQKDYIELLISRWDSLTVVNSISPSF